MDWSRMNFLWIIVMFLLAVWAIILMAPIHCRGSIGEQVMQCYIFPKTNSLHRWWPVDEHIFSRFSFWVNYPFFFLLHSWESRPAPHSNVDSNSGDSSGSEMELKVQHQTELKNWFLKHSTGSLRPPKPPSYLQVVLCSLNYAWSCHGSYKCCLEMGKLE